MVSDRQNTICHGTQFAIVSMIYANPASVNVIAHTRSCFRLMTKMIMRMNEGILCIRNAHIVSRKLYPCQKTSRENMVRKAIKAIARILGARKINLLIFFVFMVIFCDKKYCDCLLIYFYFLLKQAHLLNVFYCIICLCQMILLFWQCGQLYFFMIFFYEVGSCLKIL